MWGAPGSSESAESASARRPWGFELVGEEVAEAGELEGAGDDVGAVGLADGGVVGLGFVVLVGDVAYDGFEEVFDGDEAGYAAVLVDDDAHVLLLALHLAEELGDFFGLGDEGYGALDLGDGAVAGFGVGDVEEVVGEGDAGDVVERAGVDGDAGEGVLLDDLSELLEGEVPGTAKISGRGVMTSRTTLSPNSMTERTSSRSDSSRMPSSSPASRSASMASEGWSSSVVSSGSASAAMESRSWSSMVMGRMT